MHRKYGTRGEHIIMHNNLEYTVQSRCGISWLSTHNDYAVYSKHATVSMNNESHLRNDETGTRNCTICMLCAHGIGCHKTAVKTATEFTGAATSLQYKAI